MLGRNAHLYWPTERAITALRPPSPQRAERAELVAVARRACNSAAATADPHSRQVYLDVFARTLRTLSAQTSIAGVTGPRQERA